MTIKPDQRALRPNGTSIPGAGTAGTNAPLRPAKAAGKARVAERGGPRPRPASQMQAQTGASMDYQLGFSSGPAG